MSISKEQYEAAKKIVNQYEIDNIEESIECPFCHEVDFDKSGLKYHLFKYCKGYLETEL